MNSYLHPVTPAELSQALTTLCQRIVPNGAPPVYVDVCPLPGAPSKECFPIVDEYVLSHGGSSVIGWSLWELPTLFIEAEFHSIWQSPDGALLDIAPKVEPTDRILFLHDPARRYEGRQVNNVRTALRQDSVVNGFLQSCDEEFEFLNRGVRAGQHEHRLKGAEEVAEYRRIQMKEAQFQDQMLPLFPQVGPYRPCLCGSGKKAKWCHGVTK